MNSPDNGITQSLTPLFTLTGKRALRAANGRDLCQVPSLRVDLTGERQVKLSVMLPEATDPRAFTWHTRYADASWLPKVLEDIQRMPEEAFGAWFGWVRPQTLGTSGQELGKTEGASTGVSAEDLGL